jgi:hypothetical protein
MITIHYSTKDQSLVRIEEKLKELSLAYQTKVDENVQQLTLKDGTETNEGEAAIQLYLEKLQGELDQWYYCAC